MAQKTIKFFKNHNNKLKCQYFTTIRPGWFEEPYYIKGELYGIILDGKFEFQAEIIEIRPFLIRDLNRFISFLDAALDIIQYKVLIDSMYRNIDLTKEKLLFILLKKIE